MISIVTATFNAAKALPSLIQSLDTQTTKKFEWIVIDGASDDGTVELLKNAQGLVSRWISEPDFGIYHALNKGMKLARGDYYLVLGADDVLDPSAIERYQKAVDATGADIISAPVLVDGRLVMPRKKLSWMRSGPPLVSAHSVGTLIRRSLHDELGPYSRSYPIAADTLFLLHAWKAGKRFAYLDQPAGTFGSAGVSSTDVLGALSESMRANVQVRGAVALQLAMFVLRVMKNSRRIVRKAAATAAKP